MPRPKTKSELLALSQSNLDKLIAFIQSLDSEEQLSDFPSGRLNKNIPDVLMHLHHWHLMMLKWYEIGMTGEKPEMPAPGYTWKTTFELNHFINKKYKGTPLKKALRLLQKSHSSVMSLIE